MSRRIIRDEEPLGTNSASSFLPKDVSISRRYYAVSGLTEDGWLYAGVDSESNDLLHKQFEPTINNVLADRFFASLRDKHDIDDATVLVDRSVSFQRACRKMTSILDTNDMEIGTASNVFFVR